MTYNTWTMININSTIFTDRTITKPTILEIKRMNKQYHSFGVQFLHPSASEIILLSSQTVVLEIKSKTYVGLFSRFICFSTFKFSINFIITKFLNLFSCLLLSTD